LVPAIDDSEIPDRVSGSNQLREVLPASVVSASTHGHFIDVRFQNFNEARRPNYKPCWLDPQQLSNRKLIFVEINWSERAGPQYNQSRSGSSSVAERQLPKMDKPIIINNLWKPCPAQKNRSESREIFTGVLKVVFPQYSRGFQRNTMFDTIEPKAVRCENLFESSDVLASRCQ
jgi:hypothetical protein